MCKQNFMSSMFVYCSWLLQEEIGEGGNGKVMLATYKEELVAVKTIQLAELGPGAKYTKGNTSLLDAAQEMLVAVTASAGATDKLLSLTGFCIHCVDTDEKTAINLVQLSPAAGISLIHAKWELWDDPLVSFYLGIHPKKGVEQYGFGPAASMRSFLLCI